MSRIEGRVSEDDETSIESTIKFVLTVLVTTVIVAMAVYVLSAPMFGAGSMCRRIGPPWPRSTSIPDVGRRVAERRALRPEGSAVAPSPNPCNGLGDGLHPPSRST